MVSFNKIIDLARWIDSQYFTKNGVTTSAYDLSLNYNDPSKLMDTAVGIKQQFINWQSTSISIRPTNASISYNDYTTNPLGNVVVVTYDINGNLV